MMIYDGADARMVMFSLITKTMVTTVMTKFSVSSNEISAYLQRSRNITRTLGCLIGFRFCNP